MLALLDNILIHIFSFDEFPIRELVLTFLHAALNHFVAFILANNV